MMRLKHDSQYQATSYKAHVHPICRSFPASLWLQCLPSCVVLAGDAHWNHLCPNSRLIFWIFCNKLGPSRVNLFCSSSLFFFFQSLYALSCSERRPSPHLLVLRGLLFTSRILFYWLPLRCFKKTQREPRHSPFISSLKASLPLSCFSASTQLLSGPALPTFSGERYLSF